MGDQFIDCEGKFTVDPPIADPDAILVYTDCDEDGTVSEHLVSHEACPWQYDQESGAFYLDTNEHNSDDLEDWIVKIRDILQPRGYTLNGTVFWQEMYTDNPTDHSFFGKIVVNNNVVELYQGRRDYVLEKRDILK